MLAIFREYSPSLGYNSSHAPTPVKTTLRLFLPEEPQVFPHCVRRLRLEVQGLVILIRSKDGRGSLGTVPQCCTQTCALARCSIRPRHPPCPGGTSIVQLLQTQPKRGEQEAYSNHRSVAVSAMQLGFVSSSSIRAQSHCLGTILCESGSTLWARCPNLWIIFPFFGRCSLGLQLSSFFRLLLFFF